MPIMINRGNELIRISPKDSKKNRVFHQSRSYMDNSL